MLNVYTSKISNLLLPLGVEGPGTVNLDIPLEIPTTIFKKKRGVIRNFAKFRSQENTCAKVYFSMNCEPQVCNFIKRETPA